MIVVILCDERLIVFKLKSIKITESLSIAPRIGLIDLLIWGLTALSAQ